MMMSRLRKNAWTLLALLAGGLLLAVIGCEKSGPTGQPQSLTLAGKVQTLDPTSGQTTVLTGARVNLDSNTNAARVQMTGSDGGFSFDNVLIGRHTLRIAHQSIPIIDTVLNVSNATGLLSFTRFTGLVEVFPLAMGAIWLYDFAYRQYDADGLGHAWHQKWQKGTERFTVLGVSDAGSEWRWMIREEDDLVQSDTVWRDSSYSADVGYTIKPEVHLNAELTFVMHEEKSGLHKITSDSCSALWLVPWHNGGYGEYPGDHQYDYILTRFISITGDTVRYQKPYWNGPALKESRTLVRNVGLVQCYMYLVSGVNMPLNYTWWGTMLSYTPGQASSSTVMGKRP
jgi:hypothetical protein